MLPVGPARLRTKPLHGFLLGFLAGSQLLTLGSIGRANAQTNIDGIENIYGATNIHAVTGHGRMSAGVSSTGDLTVLTWPSPSYSDQLAYVTSNAFDARELPRFGAVEEAGLFLGLYVQSADTSLVTWLRDPATWHAEQDYGPDDGPNVHTRFESDVLGLRVTLIDAISPDADLLVRHAAISRQPDSPVEQAWVLTYANLSPVPPSSRVPELPVVDWVFDGRNDFAALWDGSNRAIVHFHPDDQRVYRDLGNLLLPPSADWGPVGDALKSDSPSPAQVEALLANLDEDYAPGVYLALSTSPGPDQHQIGFDEAAVCDTLDEIGDNLLLLPERQPGLDLPLDPGVLDLLRCPDSRPTPRDTQGWTYSATEAFADASDGSLEGSDIAAGEVSEALRTPVTFDSNGSATVDVWLAASSTAEQARSILTQAPTGTAVIEAAAGAVSTWLSNLTLPEADPEARAIARRSLINLRVGTDSDTGAIVASISRQPPYGLDWLRDGAFFNAALDISGQYELVTKRASLYGQWQRSEGVAPTPIIDAPAPPRPDGKPAEVYPADTWEMNYYPDGMVGGLFRFEIDNTAFALWTIVAHVGWVPEAERSEYLRSNWDTIVGAADFLVYWKDELTGLHFPAQEDDNPGYRQTLNGAVPVFGALDIAARAARFLGEDEAAQRWESRATEVQTGILTHLYDPVAMRFVRDVDSSAEANQSGPTGTTGWLIWPMTLLPWSDDRARSQLLSDLRFIEPQIYLETRGGQYFMKNTVSFGLTLGQEPGYADRVVALRNQLETHPTQGTRHFGEAMVVVRNAGDTPRASQRVATPHLWEGVLFYLTSMAVEQPDAFLAYDRVLPRSTVLGSRIDDGSSGSGCSACPSSSPRYRFGSALLLMLIVGGAMLVQRRTWRRSALRMHSEKGTARSRDSV
jgi:hypothetical protein